MLLKDVGEVCILDLETIIAPVYRELKRLNHKLTQRDRKVIESVITEMLDAYLTRNMFWTKRISKVPEEFWVRKFGWLLDEMRQPWIFINEIDDKIADMLSEVIDMPTWHVVSQRNNGTIVELTLGEDYRLTDWMERHAEEYGCGVEKKRLW